MTITICISDLSHTRNYLQISKNNEKIHHIPALQKITIQNTANNETTVTKATEESLVAAATARINAVYCSNVDDNYHKRNHCEGDRKNECEQCRQQIQRSRKKQSKRKLTLRRLQKTIDVRNAYYLLREICDFKQFRVNLYELLTEQSVQLLWLQLRPPDKELIDFKWNHMLAHAVWEKIEVDYLMSWLSTLGGGFSALGEQFARCAETAGKISLKQLSIGLRLGDPFLQARCKLYYSISLIQMGRLRAAKYIVRAQYQFARNQKEYDPRLVKMCKGIWLRLQYEYGLRMKNATKSLKIAAADNGDIHV